MNFIVYADLSLIDFSKFSSDKRARMAMSSIMLTENLAVGTDRAGGIFGLAYDFGELIVYLT